MPSGEFPARLGTDLRPDAVRRLSPVDMSGFPVRTWRPDPKRLIFADASGEVFAVEQMRRLRSQMYQLDAKSPIQTVLISSALGGEGKTFISANFALALAKNKKVLLLDGDLRKPGVHELFGAPSRPGLTELLAGEAELTEVIQSGTVENLWLLPAGKPASNAAELLGDGRMAGVLELLTPIFDWMVIDSSPVLPVSDATVISRSCDAVLLVARAGVTPCASMQRAQREFGEARVLGLVLNAATVPRHGAYYYAGYGYGQGQGKGSKKRKSDGKGASLGLAQ
jgi:capsular exopolysaccharide synthesis family protein